MAATTLDRFDDDTRDVLRRFHFDAETFDALRERLRAGTGFDNVIRGDVAPPADEDVEPLPPIGSDGRAALADRGRDAIARGEVGLVILAGGMATRFGGLVKAGVEAVRGRSFLELKLADAAHAAEHLEGGALPVYLMTSFATDAEVRRLAEAAARPGLDVRTFSQFVSVRLTPDGEVFESGGRPSPYAPGHGDLVPALRRSGLLRRFREAGGKHLLMSNVDNLTATCDPAVIGFHLAHGAAITVEVAPKAPGDRGGAPARVDGRPQIVETFRFPPDFDQDRIPVFNTNTLVLDAAAIDRDFPLTWFRVQKQVDDQPVIQFERLVGELTAHLPTRFLRVDREGPDARFQPVKDPDELTARTGEIETALEARGIL